MVVSLPVYVEAARPRDGQPRIHRCRRPLFFDRPETRAWDLGRAMAKLAWELGEALRESGREPTHENLAARLFSPPLETRQCKFSVDLRRHIVKCRFLFVTFAALGRVVAFTPSVPDLWFEVAPGEDLGATAERVVAAHFGRLVEHEGWTYARLDALSLTGRAWVTAVDVRFTPGSRLAMKRGTCWRRCSGAGRCTATSSWTGAAEASTGCIPTSSTARCTATARSPILTGCWRRATGGRSRSSARAWSGRRPSSTARCGAGRNGGGGGTKAAGSGCWRRSG